MLIILLKFKSWADFKIIFYTNLELLVEGPWSMGGWERPLHWFGYTGSVVTFSN